MKWTGRVEVSMAVTMKNVIFWDIKPQFIPYRRHIMSLLQSPASWCYVRYEVFTWWLWRMASSGMLHRVALVRTDISQERIHSIIRMKRIGKLGMLAVTSNWSTLRHIVFARCMCHLLVTANGVPISPILVTLMV
jgi:hypothetical protein